MSRSPSSLSTPRRRSRRRFRTSIRWSAVGWSPSRTSTSSCIARRPERDELFGDFLLPAPLPVHRALRLEVLHREARRLVDRLRTGGRQRRTRKRHEGVAVDPRAQTDQLAREGDRQPTVIVRLAGQATKEVDVRYEARLDAG